MTLILMTGASGAIGGMLWQRLTRHELRLTDVPAEEGVDALDVTDAAAVERACRGVDAVVHLGGIAEEGPFEDVLAVNVRGTERVLHAAHRTGVPRVLLASSNHAAGLYHRSIDWWAGRWQPDRWEPHIKFGTARSSDGLHSAAWSTVWCRVSPGISTHRCERCSRKPGPRGGSGRPAAPATPARSLRRPRHLLLRHEQDGRHGRRSARARSRDGHVGSHGALVEKP